MYAYQYDFHHPHLQHPLFEYGRNPWMTWTKSSKSSSSQRSRASSSASSSVLPIENSPSVPPSSLLLTTHSASPSGGHGGISATTTTLDYENHHHEGDRHLNYGTAAAAAGANEEKVDAHHVVIVWLIQWSFAQVQCRVDDSLTIQASSIQGSRDESHIECHLSKVQWIMGQITTVVDPMDISVEHIFVSDAIDPLFATLNGSSPHLATNEHSGSNHDDRRHSLPSLGISTEKESAQTQLHHDTLGPSSASASASPNPTPHPNPVGMSRSRIHVAALRLTLLVKDLEPFQASLQTVSNLVTQVSRLQTHLLLSLPSTPMHSSLTQFQQAPLPPIYGDENNVVTVSGLSPYVISYDIVSSTRIILIMSITILVLGLDFHEDIIRDYILTCIGYLPSHPRSPPRSTLALVISSLEFHLTDAAPILSCHVTPTPFLWNNVFSTKMWWQCDIEIWYYNNRVLAREPLLEPFNFSTRMEQDEGQLMQVSIQSTNDLKLNCSAALLDSLQFWSRMVSQASSALDVASCYLRNDTGLDLRCVHMR